MYASLACKCTRKQKATQRLSQTQAAHDARGLDLREISDSASSVFRIHHMPRVLLTIPWALLVLALLPIGVVRAAEEDNARPCTTVEVYHRHGCPHCERAFAFLATLHNDHPGLEVKVFEINESPEARARFITLNQRAGVERPGVPAFLICERFLVGFDTAETTGAVIKQLMGLDVGAVTAEQTRGVDTKWFGAITAERLGLPLFTLAIGLIDGFNPCAMWVLLFLLSLLVNLRERRRIILIAGTFVLVSGAVYFAFMAAWLNVFLIIGFSRALQVGVGLLAMAIGAVHVKDFFYLHRGVTLSSCEVRIFV